jgi:hypothetical protein
MATSFAELYPNLAYWVESFGWIEMGQDDYSQSLIRVLDIGGMIWESEEEYDSLDAALQEADAAIADWFKQEKIADAP